ncbi:unnamed protein product [Clonostachys rosea]|uniref:Uncharacterized protein n=1 Tax=Bionectria ochroleuca TaxID=29856 RepID=A0ABY6U3N3_BIOOC|nr:unnamed protein product [Clonostachys rosea]
MSTPHRPAWYYRVLALREEEGDLEPEAFDEDISDLESQDDQSSIGDDSDSYEEYYSLKVERERRKQVLKFIREMEQGIRGEEQKVMDKVDAVYQNLKLGLQNGAHPKPFTIPGGSGGCLFKLYSVDFHDHGPKRAILGNSLYVDFYPVNTAHGKLVQQLYEHGDFNPIYSTNEERLHQYYGHVYFNSEPRVIFSTFEPPKEADLVERNLEPDENTYLSRITFLDDRYLILTLDAEAVFGDEPIPPSAPSRFKFVGVEEEYLVNIFRPKLKAEEPVKIEEEYLVDFFGPKLLAEWEASSRITSKEPQRKTKSKKSKGHGVWNGRLRKRARRHT